MGFKYCDLRVTYNTDKALPEGYILSGAMRGIFGRTLKKIFCIQRQVKCDECMMSACFYKKVFEYRDVQSDGYKPYIISHYSTRGKQLTFQYKFLGDVTGQMQSILHTIIRTQEMNLNFDNEWLGLSIAKITDDHKETIYDNDVGKLMMPQVRQLEFAPQTKRKIHLDFETPCHARSKKGPHNTFEWNWFYLSLLRRIVYLNDNFNNNELHLPEVIVNDTPRFEADMHWYDMHHLSTRQHQKISLSGLIGNVTIYNPHPDTVGLLKLGETLHVGKQTTFGLGRYKINK